MYRPMSAEPVACSPGGVWYSMLAPWAHQAATSSSTGFLIVSSSWEELIETF